MYFFPFTFNMSHTLFIGFNHNGIWVEKMLGVLCFQCSAVLPFSHSRSLRGLIKLFSCHQPPFLQCLFLTQQEWSSDLCASIRHHHLLHPPSLHCIANSLRAITLDQNILGHKCLFNIFDVAAALVKHKDECVLVG